mmetsp:Transcript_54135/g.86077  ORF Transcript_54135/g.86077 Transcript_54135/m.86077 type:complete len:511 (+) Transcript_54135:50-1582(+)
MFRPVGTPPPPLRVSRPGSPVMLQALPPEVKQTNPLYGAKICKNFGNGWFYGRVVDVEADEQTGELAYCVEYSDGDWEHLAEREVRAHLWRCTGAPIRQSCAPTPSVSRPASLAPATRPASLAPMDGANHRMPAEDATPLPIGRLIVGSLFLIALVVFSWSWDSVSSTTSQRQCDNSGHCDILDFSATSLSSISFEIPLVTTSVSTSLPSAEPAVVHPYVAPERDEPAATDKVEDDQLKYDIEDLTSLQGGEFAQQSDSASRDLAGNSDSIRSETSAPNLAFDLDTILAATSIFLVASFFCPTAYRLCLSRKSVQADRSTHAPILVPTQLAPASDDNGSLLSNSPSSRVDDTQTADSIAGDPYTLPFSSPVPAAPHVTSPSPVRASAPATISSAVQSSPVLESLPSTSDDNILLAPTSQGGLRNPVPTPSRSPSFQSMPPPKRIKKTHQIESDEGTASTRKKRLPSPSRFRYSSGLEQMKAMGFEDTADLREALTLNQGRVSGALQEYLG